MSVNELEDIIAIDNLIMLITAPVWITGFLALIVAGAWNDWRACG
jgi:hypothetical protein